MLGAGQGWSHHHPGDPRLATFTLTTGQLVACTFAVVLALGVLGGGAYVIGRHAAEVSSKADPRASRGDQVLLVDPAANSLSSSSSRSGKSLSSFKAPGFSSLSSSTATSLPAGPSTSLSPPAAPTAPPDGLYLQVAALPLRAAQSLQERLVQQHLPATIAPGPDPATFRVLVGPASGRDELETWSRDLRAAGFEPFPRRYPSGELSAPPWSSDSGSPSTSTGRE